MTGLPLVGEEFAGYRLVSVLGRGGMSIVFRAENPRLGNVIALKVLDPALADDDVFRTRFLEESRIAASMNHPHVIPIHDMGSSDGLLYIAMRCVTGTDLRQMLKKRGRLQPDTALFLLEQAGRALDAAHRRGLVHRDVKPGNLLVERGNDGTDPEHVYLADFGITRHLGGRTGLTSSEMFLGTIDYVAPEQIRGLPVLGLADQYSLGCVLYECLTGRVPFEKDLDAAIIWAHVEEAPTPPTTHRPDLPPPVDAVFTRVLAKRPEDRFPNCRDFLAAARDALGRLADAPQARGPMPPLPRRPLVLPYPVAAQRHLAADDGAELLASPPAELAHESPDAFRAPPAPWTGQEPVPQAEPMPEPPTGQAPPPSAHEARVARPGWRRRHAAVLAAALALVAGGAAGVTVAMSGHGGATAASRATTAPATSAPATSAAAVPTGSAAMAPMSATATASESPRTANCAPGGRVALAAKNRGQSGPTTLDGVLQQANLCSTPQGDLPPGKCQVKSANSVTCTAPATGVATVDFRTYSSLAALYTQYVNQVTVLNGSFQQNTTARCGNSLSGYAEAGWNHVEAHPTQYSVQEMESTAFNQVNAMGRQACFVANGKPYLVWTTDVGRLLAVAEGGGSMSALYNWWAQIHHVIIFRGTEMCGPNMGRMASVPQGNLKSSMVCPAGATPGSGG